MIIPFNATSSIRAGGSGALESAYSDCDPQPVDRTGLYPLAEERQGQRESYARAMFLRASNIVQHEEAPRLHTG